MHVGRGAQAVELTRFGGCVKYYVFPVFGLDGYVFLRVCQKVSKQIKYGEKMSEVITIVTE